jgi:hypothetical protein
LRDPDFLEQLRAAFPDGRILPDEEDFDLEINPQTDSECAEEYRLAQAKRVTRLWREWKAGQL